ncbi:LicD family protein [Orrella marina]|uniref:LicD/FKTN/FKRP nucleotidyltransferase domain-containing protein n=1 Tax=Orrella marina TaxID=2163011 RepID=A0A2R4XGT1_9BURK|nr:LicD family protein [Orrella marina]AWB33020.1 hypothetical protein DBV39_04010 [Orrella marina]
MTLPLNPDDSYTLTQADLTSLQDGLLRLLVEFDRVCQKLGIPYQLGAGTLLGAVRHQGFVPWDDDADVCLLRSDYERLLALGSSELSPGFFLQHAGSEPAHPWLFAKLRLDGTEFVCPETQARDIHQGIYLDIFPFDDVRPHSATGKAHLELTRWVRIARAIYQTGRQRKLATRRAYPVRLIVNLAYRFVRDPAITGCSDFALSD